MNQKYKNIGNGLLGTITDILKNLNSPTAIINDEALSSQLTDISSKIVEARNQFKTDITKIVEARKPGINYKGNVGLCGKTNLKVNINAIVNKKNAINIGSTEFPPIMCMDQIINVLKSMNKIITNKANKIEKIKALRKLINNGNTGKPKEINYYAQSNTRNKSRVAGPNK
jgi:hypothetical protein